MTSPRTKVRLYPAPKAAEPLLLGNCPPCFEPVQWHQWRMPLPGARLPRPHSFCDDCTPDYQAKMLAAMRCLHPETVFIRDADGFISGHRPPQPRTQEPNT